MGTALLFLVIVVSALLQHAPVTKKRAISGTNWPQVCGVWGLAAIESLAWGTAVSLRVRRSIVALVVTMMAWLLVMNSFTAALVTQSVADRGSYWQSYVTAIPYRVLLLALVLAYIATAENGWLHPGRAQRSWRLVGQFCAQSVLGTAASRLFPVAHRRLIWQTWRQARGLLALFGGLGVAIGIFISYYIISVYGRPIFVPGVEESLVFLFAMLGVPATLIGTCVFQADKQMQRYRFFAERGVRPFAVWASRQLVWIAGLAAWMIVAGAICFWGPETCRQCTDELRREFHGNDLKGDFYSFTRALEAIGFVLPLVALAYAAGQLASMFIRSSVLAGVVGIVCKPRAVLGLGVVHA